MKTIGRNIGFLGNCMAESTVYFFVLILNIIFKAMIEIEIFEKNPCVEKIRFEGRFLIFHTLLKINYF